MLFPDPLRRGRLLRRYKRFLADVEWVDTVGGEEPAVVAHCANPGSMMGLADPGSEVWLSPARNPERKLRWSLELVRAPSTGALVGVNTSLPNRLVEEALDAGILAELSGYARRRREVRYGDRSRVDFLLEDDARPPCYVEVKSVTLARPELSPEAAELAAEFPDAVTARGAKHLGELATVAAAGARAVLLYVVQRGDCSHVRVAGDIDPAYAAALSAARAAGVECLAYRCGIDTGGIAISGPPLPVEQ